MVNDKTCHVKLNVSPPHLYLRTPHTDTHTYTTHNTHESTPQTKTTRTRALRTRKRTQTHSNTRLIRFDQTHMEHTRSRYVSISQTQKQMHTRVYGHASRENLHYTRALAHGLIHTKQTLRRSFLELKFPPSPARTIGL